MAKITIDKESDTPSGWKFIVTVASNDNTTQHTVSVSKKSWVSLTEEQITPPELVTKTFEFLLERESNESILRAFDITIISHYFPDFPSKLKKNILSR